LPIIHEKKQERAKFACDSFSDKAAITLIDLID